MANLNLSASKAMALIPEGAFTMGSNMGPDDEKPAHTVSVKSFFIDVLPISNAEFAEFLNSQGLRNQRSEAFTMTMTMMQEYTCVGQNGRLMTAMQGTLSTKSVG